MPVGSAPGRRLAPLMADCLTDLPGIGHGFFTRQGGQSSGLYRSLNCGVGSKDDKQTVQDNRALVSAHLSANTLLTAHQIHSDHALLVAAPWPPGIARPKADALVTKTRGLAVAALTADCTPVLFADPTAGVIGAAHAGWRGAVGGILEATISTMVKAGAKHANIRAAIGPCINQDAYQVSFEFEADLLRLDVENAQFFKKPAPGARPHFDLPGYVFHRLSRAELAMVEQQSLCTYETSEQFYSFRRSLKNTEPDYGRQISAIVLA